MDDAQLVRLHRGFTGDGDVHMNPGHVAALRRVASAVWEEALQYVWKLNDPAWTCFEGELSPGEYYTGILLAEDIDQARDGNPYE